MISRWLRRHVRRERWTEQVQATQVWRPALQSDSAARPVAWWRAL